MPRAMYNRSASPAPSSSSQSDIEDDDVNKSTFFPSIDPVIVSPAQWTSKVHLLNSPASAHSSPASLLPPEILIHVFKHLHSNRDIHSCLLVSRNWCECSVELLWHKPGISKLPTFIKMMRILARVDQTFTYARFIRRLNFLFLGKDLNNALFSRLSQCIRLERLTLVNCSTISDDSLTHVFISCPNLVAIDLTGVTDTTDRAIVALASTCKRLQGINLGGCKEVTEKGIFALAANCPLLRRVKLSGIEAITDRAVSALARSCPLLLEIDLNGCKCISDISVRDLWTYSLHMREMRLGQCTQLTDFAFPSVVKEVLPTSGINPFPSSVTKEPTKDALPSLLLSRPFDHLRMLDLTSCSKLTDDAIEGIVSNSPKIRNLVLAKCSMITDVAVESICKLGKHLHYLHLGHTSNITDRSVRQLARSCTRLKYIDLANCTLLTDMSVFELSSLQKLRRIGLVRVNNLTDQAVYALADRHATLERIHLSYCDQISVMAIHFLLQKLPKLTHLSLTGIGAFRKPELQQFCRQPPSDFNSSQRAAFCVFSGKGVAELRVYLQEIFNSLTEEAEGDNDTDYDDFDFDEDRPLGMDAETGNEGDEELDVRPAPRVFIAPSIVSPRPHRTRHTSPGRNQRTAGASGQVGVHRRSASHQDITLMDVDPVILQPAQPARVTGHIPSNGPAQYVAHGMNSSPYGPPNLTSNVPNTLLNGGGRRPRGFGQQPLIEPPTSPTPSDAPSTRSAGTTHSHGAGFFRSYHEAVAAASSSRHHTMTPDLNYAEIGHGRGANELGNSSNGSSSSTVRGYDVGEMNLPLPIPRRGYAEGGGPQGSHEGQMLLDSSNSFHHPMERESGAWPHHNRRQRTRDRNWDATNRSLSTSPATRELQESVQSALEGGGAVGGQSMIGVTDGRGRAGKRGWRTTLSAAEQYASSFLFGGRGNGSGSPSTGIQRDD